MNNPMQKRTAVSAKETDIQPADGGDLSPGDDEDELEESYEGLGGQLQFKLCQIRSNFKIQKFLAKVYLFCAVLPKNFKNDIFYVRQLEMPKTAFHKCDVIIFTCFFTIAQAKPKILL